MKMSWQPFTAAKRKELIAGGSTYMTTFRKGGKWCDPALVGQLVDFVDEADDQVFATGVIVSVKACAFRDIDNQDISRQSSEMAHMTERLAVMQRVYKDPSYSGDTITTVVTIGSVREVSELPKAA